MNVPLRSPAARPALGAVALTLSMLAMSPALANDSAYTSLKSKDCTTLAGGPEAPTTRVECPSRHGYRVVVVGEHDRSWLEIAMPGHDTISLMEETVARAPGHFPNVAETVLEWRYRDNGGGPVALIHRISAITPEAPGRTVSALMVVGVGRGRLCVLGMASSNAAARALADAHQDCR